MYVGWRALPTNIHFLVKFRISKIHNVIDIKLIFIKLWIFTNFNTVLVLIFDFEDMYISEEVLHGLLVKLVTSLEATCSKASKVGAERIMEVY
jgi:hypothetical protein